MDSIEAMAMDAMSAAAADEMIKDIRSALHKFLEESPVVNGTRDGALMAFANVAAHGHVGLPLGRYGDPATEEVLAAVVPVFLAIAHLIDREDEYIHKARTLANSVGESLSRLKDNVSSMADNVRCFEQKK